MRGFALTRQDTFLEPYRRGTVAFERSLRQDHAARPRRRRPPAAWRPGRGRPPLAPPGRGRDPGAADPSRPALRPQAGRAAQAPVRPLPHPERPAAPRPGGGAQARARPRGRGLGRRDHPAGAAVRRPGLRGHRAPVAPRAGAPRGERLYRQTQAEFAETIQIMRDEGEAHALVKHHLEREIDGVTATVLVRNNSDDRLVAATPVDDDSPLRRAWWTPRPRAASPCAWRAPTSRATRSAPLLPCKAVRQVGGRGHLRAVAGQRRGHRLGADPGRPAARGGRARARRGLHRAGVARAGQPAQPGHRRDARVHGRADRPAQLALLPRQPQADGGPLRSARWRRSPRSWWTWITSSRSTTASATAPATMRWPASATCCAARCGPATSPAGTAARSS